MFGRIHLLALVAAGCLCVGVATAGADNPAIGCGATLTTSTTLTADIVNCPGTALVIGADGITVNLGGHTLSGTNATDSEGIANDGHAGVKILGSGRITNFRLNGVGMRNAPNSVVRGVTIRRIGAGGVEGEPVSAGILLSDSPGSKIVANDVQNNVNAFQSDGADVINSPRTVVEGNTLSHNSWNGLVLLASPESRIVGNQLDANPNNGTEVNGGSDSVLVAGNSADRNTAVGIVLGSSRNARITGNSARGNDAGLFFFDLHDSAIVKNSATSNGVGIVLTGGQFGSHGNTLKGNFASGNQDTGIVVEEDDQGAASGNTLTGNTANKNKGHGIDATADSIDGGGNHASGNATPPQCVNVAC